MRPLLCPKGTMAREFRPRVLLFKKTPSGPRDGNSGATSMFLCTRESILIRIYPPKIDTNRSGLTACLHWLGPEKVWRKTIDRKYRTTVPLHKVEKLRSLQHCATVKTAYTCPKLH